MTHPELVAALAKDGKDILAGLTPEDCHIMHMALALPGEVGELIDPIKKSIIYNKTLDLENVIEEMGDIEFYLEGLRQAYDIDREEVLAANIAKLTERYGSKYSDKAAQERVDKRADQ